MCLIVALSPNSPCIPSGSSASYTLFSEARRIKTLQFVFHVIRGGCDILNHYAPITIMLGIGREDIPVNSDVFRSIDHNSGLLCTFTPSFLLLCAWGWDVFIILCEPLTSTFAYLSRPSVCLFHLSGIEFRFAAHV